MSGIDEEMVLVHFIVSDDVERSRRFYTEVPGSKTVISGEMNDAMTYVTLAPIRNRRATAGGAGGALVLATSGHLIRRHHRRNHKRGCR